MKINSVLSKLFSSKGFIHAPFFRRNGAGFTLIELLIVIAILGILAAGILVTIDPVEQLARGRDAGRKSSVTQIGRALQTYYTSNSAYPVAVAGWQNTLVNSGEMKLFPSNPPGVTAPCTGGAVFNEFCYKWNATPNIIVYTRMESKVEQNKSTCAGVAANTWYVYSSSEGRAGVFCKATEPLIGDGPLF